MDSLTDVREFSYGRPWILLRTSVDSLTDVKILSWGCVDSVIESRVFSFGLPRIPILLGNPMDLTGSCVF